MNSLKILNTKEKKKIIQKLSEQFGVKELKGILMMRGKEKIFLFQGDLTEKQFKELEKTILIERVGVYLGKIQADELRLSIEGSQILKDQITKNIFELNKEQAEQWMMGRELNISSGFKGFVVMKYKNDFLGCGKASKEKITNFIPKSRRLKSREIIILKESSKKINHNHYQ